MPTTQLPKQEEIMASNNDLSGFVPGDDTEIALLGEKKDVLFLPCPLLLLSNFSLELATLAGCSGGGLIHLHKGVANIKGTTLRVMIITDIHI